MGWDVQGLCRSGVLEQHAATGSRPFALVFWLLHLHSCAVPEGKGLMWMSQTPREKPSLAGGLSGWKKNQITLQSPVISESALKESLSYTHTCRLSPYHVYAYTQLTYNLIAPFSPFVLESQYKVSPKGINKENGTYRATIFTQKSKMLMDFANITTVLTQMPL